jgi:hypothetical protein
MEYGYSKSPSFDGEAGTTAPELLGHLRPLRRYENEICLPESDDVFSSELFNRF